MPNTKPGPGPTRTNTPVPATPSRPTPPPRKAGAGHHARNAAATVDRNQHLTVTLPVVGQVTLPQPEDLAYVGGIAALVALELIDWPVAVALGVGHALSSQHRSRGLAELGQALDDA